jgi:hypothetical protein
MRRLEVVATAESERGINRERDLVLGHRISRI